jgi:hypothetical protein
MNRPNRINATLARRIAAAREARNDAWAATYSAETFARWLACVRRANALRAALLDRLEGPACQSQPQSNVA